MSIPIDATLKMLDTLRTKLIFAGLSNFFDAARLLYALLRDPDLLLDPM